MANAVLAPRAFSDSNSSLDESMQLRSTLNEVLEAETSNQGMLLKPSSIKIITSALRNYSSTKAPVHVFNRLETFLQCSSVNSVIISDGDALFALLFAVLDVVCKTSVSEYCDDESVESAKPLILKILDVLDNLPFSIDDSKIPVFASALPEIASFSYVAFTRNDFSHLNKRLVQKICSIIFNSKTKMYESLLVLNDQIGHLLKPNKDLVNFFVQLQKLIQKQEDVYNGIPGDIACGALLKNILSEIFIQNKSGLEPLNVLALLCAISGLDIPLLITVDSCYNDALKVNENEQVVNIAVLSMLLEVCTDYPQYFNIPSVSEGHLKPSDWLNGITTALLDANLTKNKCALLKCFRYLLKISVSVVENNITSVIKLCLLDINVHSRDSKEEYCNLFKELFSLHSRLHQIPKFFVKLLLALTECIKENSAGKLILRGQVFPLVLESLALHVQELPFGQVIELWKIFSETYTTFMNMSQIFPAGKGAVLFIAQLFSNFLLHSKLFDAAIPDNAFTKFGDLIQHTTNEMINNSYILTDSEEAQLPQQSFLLLCYALGEIKLYYNYNNEESSNDSFTLKFPDNPLDCSLLLSFLGEKQVQVFEIFLKSEDKALSFLVYQLLIQKIRGLIHKTELSSEEDVHLKKSVSTLLHHVRENIHSHGSWDLDMCTLNDKNYGSAVWRMLLKYFPLVLNHVDSKELILICGCFKDIMLQESSSGDSREMDLKSIILTELQSPYFQNSKLFQSALIASLWKLDPMLLIKKRSLDEMESGNNFWNVLSQLSVFRTKWIKYAESIPKCKDEELNPLWANLKDACICLNQILQSESVVKIRLKNEIYSILKLIDCLPLEYLLPGSKLQCMIGLSIFLFLAPESCKADEALKVAKQISKQLVAIFDGKRSVWFFDFVLSGPYLGEIVNTIDRLMDKKQEAETYEWCKILLNPLINRIVKYFQNLSAAEEYFSQFLSEKQVSPTTCITLLILMEKLSQILRRAYLQPQFKEVYEKVAVSACCSCVKLLKKYEGSYNDSVFSTLIQCYTEVIELVTLPSLIIDQKKKEKCLAQLPKVLKIAAQSISDHSNNNKIYFNLFSKVFKHIQDFGSCVPENLHTEIWESIRLQLQQHCSSLVQSELSDSEPLSFSDDEIELFQSLFHVLPEEKISSIFEEILEEINCQDIDELNAYRLQMNLNIVTQIIESELIKEEPVLSSSSLLNLMFQLNIIVNKANHSELHLKKFKIPVLDFINFLVKLQKWGIPRHSLIQCLHFCVVVRFQDILEDLPNFVKTFNAVWNVVYNLLNYHVPVVLSATAPYLSVVTTLLKSIVRAGSQDAVSAADSTTQMQMISCAKSMDRLLNMMAQHKRDFAKLVPYLIADYVDCVQHITLESNVKNHLLSGLDCLLALCSENSLNMIAVNINHSCRDIYSNIVKNYKQYCYRGGV